MCVVTFYHKQSTQLRKLSILTGFSSVAVISEKSAKLAGRLARRSDRGLRARCSRANGVTMNLFSIKSQSFSRQRETGKVTGRDEVMTKEEGTEERKDAVGSSSRPDDYRRPLIAPKGAA